MWALKNRSTGLYLAKRGSKTVYTAFKSDAEQFQTVEDAWKRMSRDEKPTDLERGKRR